MHDVLGLLHHLAFRDPQGRLGYGHGKVVDLDAVELANGDLNGVCYIAQHNLVGKGAERLIFQLAQGDISLRQEVAGTTGGIKEFQSGQLVLVVFQAALPSGLHGDALDFG